MAVRTGGTPVDSSIWQRAAAAVSTAARAVGDWFGPGQPTQPVAPPEVKGRALDFPFAFNVGNWVPRSEQGENTIDFPTLRQMADPPSGGHDLLRLAIETRKDQMAAQKWAVKARSGEDGGDLARAIERLLRKPDGFHTFAQWQRMVLEDMLVIDAATVYFAPTGRGYLLPEVIDGGTIKVLLNEDGRRPLPPEFAYQQTLKGLPAVDYTADELLQLPRNLRSHRVYGMSPVEQVAGIVNIAINRQMSQLEYYTAGSVPDVVIGTPESWNAQQIADFQQYWDSILSGNTEERRRARFIPHGVTPTVLKADSLKDMYDEWLARVICYAFSLPPSALVKETNRATAETAKEAAQEEGLEPIKAWFKDLMDEVLARCFGADDLEWSWVDEEIADPTMKAEVMATALGKGGGKPWMTIDEVRDAYGLAPMTPEQAAQLAPPAPLALPPGQTPPPGNAPPPPGRGPADTGAPAQDGDAGGGGAPPQQKAAAVPARRSLRPPRGL